MKHHLIRVLSALMACTLLLACFGTGFAAEAPVASDHATQADRPTLPAEMLEVKSVTLSDAEGKALNNLCEEHQRSPQAKSQSNSVAVKKRDWSKYTSHNAATSRLSSAEKEFYKRLDSACRIYIEQPDHYVKSGKFIYIDENIKYADLGISNDDAARLYAWFRLSNPQYYFLSEWCTQDGATMHATIYDFVKDLANEAKVTNEMFDKLDRWISECTKSGQTAWDKVIAIDKKICENIRYSRAVLNGDDGAAANENQTIYSVLMTPETVCAGYAETFAAMANAMGVDALAVNGSTKDSSHRWNTVQFDDGKYYTVDACWDDMDNNRICDFRYIGLGADDTSHKYGGLVSPYAPAIASTAYGGYGRLEFSDGSVYTGGWKAGKKEGYGILVDSDGTSYEGYWTNGKLNGFAIHYQYRNMYAIERKDDVLTGDGFILFPNGTMTSAQWKNDRIISDSYNETDTLHSSSGAVYQGTVSGSTPNGYGKATYTDGGVYIGNWKNGISNGTGKYTWPDGSYYFGAWDNSKRTGTGIFQWSNGNFYVGSFLDTKLDGQGRYIWANGNVYEGAWKTDRPNGYGVMRYNSGCFYIGEWKDGQRDGQGKYTWPSGQVYEGGWKNGKYDGYGTITAANGARQSGQWKDGQFVSGSSSGNTGSNPGGSTPAAETLSWDAQNGTYTGGMKNGLRDGYGRMELSNGASYEGEWKNGTMSGKGKYTWADGKVYDGEFKNGKGDGYGTLTYPNGTKKSGQWKDGQFVG